MYKTARTNRGGHAAVTEHAKKVVSDYQNCSKSIIVFKNYSFLSNQQTLASYNIKIGRFLLLGIYLRFILIFIRFYHYIMLLNSTQILSVEDDKF